MKHVIIGTAGHVDHGKTALVKALTGQETEGTFLAAAPVFHISSLTGQGMPELKQALAVAAESVSPAGRNYCIP